MKKCDNAEGCPRRGERGAWTRVTAGLRSCTATLGIVQNWRCPTCPSTAEGVRALWSIERTGFRTATEKNELLHQLG